MASKIGIVIVGLCIAALACEGAIYRLAHPSYRTARFENDRLEVSYPASWGQPHYGIAKRRDLQGLSLGTFGDTVPDFGTRWDRYKNIYLRIDLLGPKELEGSDPKAVLIARYQKEHKRSFGAQTNVPSGLQPVTVAGREGWMLSQPYEDEPLDIIMPWQRPEFHPLKMIYGAFFGGEQTKRTMLVRLKSGWLEIDYYIPGDKIERARYEKIYGAILDSLKIKDA
jgi:hypothetical protein